MRVAIAAGHSARSPGMLTASGAREHPLMVQLAAQLAAKLAVLGIEHAVFTRQDVGSYRAAMDLLVDEVNAWRPTLAIELHCDEAPGLSVASKWQGPTGLYWPGSVEGARWARRLADAVQAVTGAPHARAREQSRSNSGQVLYWLRDTACPAVILETHYGHHPEDHARYLRAAEGGGVAHAIAAAVTRYG